MFFNPIISKHIKNLFRASIKKFFKCSKSNKLRILAFPFYGFGPVPPLIYTTREKSHCVVCRSNKSRFLKQKNKLTIDVIKTR